MLPGGMRIRGRSVPATEVRDSANQAEHGADDEAAPAREADDREEDREGTPERFLPLENQPAGDHRDEAGDHRADADDEQVGPYEIRRRRGNDVQDVEDSLHRDQRATDDDEIGHAAAPGARSGPRVHQGSVGRRRGGYRSG